MDLNKKITVGIGWKFLERFGVVGIQFLLQLVLARLLTPEDYGLLSLMLIFTNLAQVFILSGLNTALIQKKDATEEDFSSVFWLSMTIAGIFYVVLFVSAPAIGIFYNMPRLASYLRVLALVLFPGALNSIQLAAISRKMDFKQAFRSSIAGISLGGMAGIILAFAGAGAWALVAQSLINTLITCVVMWFTVKWKPRFVFSLNRIRGLFSFGWKILVAGLMETLYNDLSSLIIGSKYSAGTLGYYNRGKQFPKVIIEAVNGTVQGVLMPAMSSQQEDLDTVKKLVRSSANLSAYILFPVMAGIAGVGISFITLVLTEKWLPCVPYMQIYCFTYASYTVHTSKVNAIKALGRSDVFLWLEILKKIAGILMLIGAVVYFDSPIAVAVTGAISSVLVFVLDAAPSKQLLEYTYGEQIQDISVPMLLSLGMLVCVLGVEKLGLSVLMTLILQIVTGVVIYVGLSALFRVKPFLQLLNGCKKIYLARRL